MHRLLQGDVGSGKTIVAALAALSAIEAGYQVALMAPTEILAEQHYLKLSGWLAPLGLGVSWLSGSLRKKAKQQALDEIASGQCRLAVGTHALFRTTSPSRSWGWPSSTSSTASASASGWRCRTRARSRTN